MSTGDLLARLQRVQQAAPDRWRAICPAHESKNRTLSLSIRELGDGTVLVRCFAGCSAGAVVEKVGLQLADLFPPQHQPPGQPRRAQRPNHWHSLREAVQTVKHECLVVAICADDVAAGRGVLQVDADRVFQAAIKIRSVIEACE